jgi:GNAT superfamily N-acetyltransferase
MMQFELNEALMDEILFSMEDQDGCFLLDTRDCIVIDMDDKSRPLDEGDTRRYIGLPDWESSDGFNLMQNFTASLKSETVRDELSRALNRGRGVFRAFKDCLSAHPEVEKLWFAFKERAMREVVLTWFNGLREEWGLEKIGPEPEETADLILEDFRFRKSDAASGDFSCEAENAEGRVIAKLNAVKVKEALEIKRLEVAQEYRGLGVAKGLLSMLMQEMGKREIYINLPVEAAGFSHALDREGFTPIITRYKYKPKDSMRGENNG